MASKNRKNFWLKRHTSDPYVQLAQKGGFRSRAAYKLLKIHEQDNLFKSGQTVLDLGSAPGAWSQVAQKQVGMKGSVFSLDRLAILPIEKVTFIQGDLEESKTLNSLYLALGDQRVDVVLSDMAPNLSGIASIDQPRSYHLIRLALDVAQQVLKPGGCFLVKCFHGRGFDAYFKELRNCFEQVLTRKPEASRAHSSEVYLLAKGYRKR